MVLGYKRADTNILPAGRVYDRKKGTAMASPSNLTVTIKPAVMIKKLEAALVRMDKEIADAEAINKAHDKRHKAWLKKVRVYASKHVSKSDADEFDTSNYRNGTIRVQFMFDQEFIIAACGEEPENVCVPTYKRTQVRYHNEREVYPYDEVTSAIALLKDCTDTELKISTKSVWLQYIK